MCILIIVITTKRYRLALGYFRCTPNLYIMMQCKDQSLAYFILVQISWFHEYTNSLFRFLSMAKSSVDSSVTVFICFSHFFNVGSTLTDFMIVRTLYFLLLCYDDCYCCCCRRRRRWWCCCCLLMVMMVLLLPIQNDANSMACTFKLNQVYRKGPSTIHGTAQHTP